MPTFVSFTYTTSPKILDKFEAGYFFYNFRISNDIDMKFEPGSKLIKRNTTKSKKIRQKRIDDKL